MNPATINNILIRETIKVYIKKTTDVDVDIDKGIVIDMFRTRHRI